MADTYGNDGTAGPAGASPEPQADAARVAETVKQQAREKLGEVRDTVKQEAANFASTAKDKASEQVERRKDAVTGTMTTFADAIRRAGDELGERDQTMAAQVIRQAADGLEGFSRSLSGKRPEEMLDAVRDLGRSHPGAFLAGSVFLGVALGRFMRSSAHHLDEEQSFSPAYADFAEDDYGADPLVEPFDPLDADAAGAEFEPMDPVIAAGDEGSDTTDPLSDGSIPTQTPRGL